MDGRDSLGSHGRVEAAANSSDDSLNSLFEDPTNPDKDSISTNSSLDPDSHERVSETEVKNGDRSRMGQSQNRPIVLIDDVNHQMSVCSPHRTQYGQELGRGYDSRIPIQLRNYKTEGVTTTDRESDGSFDRDGRSNAEASDMWWK